VGAVHIAIAVTFSKNVAGFARLWWMPARRLPHESVSRTPTSWIVPEWPSTAMEKLGLDEGDVRRHRIAQMTSWTTACAAGALASDRRVTSASLVLHNHYAKRVQALKQSGITDEQLVRIRAPVGFGCGRRAGRTRSPFRYMAEVVAVSTRARHSTHQIICAPRLNRLAEIILAACATGSHEKASAVVSCGSLFPPSYYTFPGMIKLLLDVDTLEDYKRLLNISP